MSGPDGLEERTAIFDEAFAEEMAMMLDDADSSVSAPLCPGCGRTELCPACFEAQHESDPAPYCRNGHKSAALCNCGPVRAEND